jgi:sigma-B regulation protein RsbU (phosphoserine phosphatase)
MNDKKQPYLVLIVDDDRVTVRVLDGLLRGAGFEAVSAHDLASAAEKIRTHACSLILLDLHLPDGDSYDLCEKLAAPAGIPVLFISANDDVESKVRGFTAGGVDYITKPLAGAEVLARVRTHLRLRAANEALIALGADRISRLSASQESIMPKPADLPEATFAVHLRQALRAGGDFYDVICTAPKVHDYVVADASGHDLGVSLWTASFKALLAEFATILQSPAEICRMLNNSLLRILPEAMYFTTVYARLNRTTNKLTLVNAGHPPAILVSAETGEARLLYQEGDLIGMFAETVFGVLEIAVKPGDRVFLYSDGLVETDGPRGAGFDRLCAACQAHRALPPAEAIKAIIGQVTGNVEPDDDIVLMAVTI